MTLAAACGTDNDSGFGPATDGSSSGTGAGASSGAQPSIPPGGGNKDGGGGGELHNLVIEPAEIVVEVVAGQPAPTAQFRALGNGQEITAGWTLDRGELGALSAQGLFTAEGSLGGIGTIIASVGEFTATAKIIVKVRATQNGGTANADAGGGAGGRGGVGGDPEGGPVSDQVRQTLGGAATATAGLQWLYPYDRTVWPRGLLAPQLQWRGPEDYDAVRIDVVEAHYSWTGTFARNATPFKNHPLPAEVWRAATRSNEGEDLVVRLTFAKGGVAYGPIEERWTIASAPLKGIVYYNSYGTALAKNHGDALQSPGGAFPGNTFGGATLSIRGDSTDPTLVAGGNGDTNQCYVCHTVSTDGSRLLTHYRSEEQSGFDLGTGQETRIARGASSVRYTWPGLTPDGRRFLNDLHAPAKLYTIPEGGGGPADAVEVATTGLPDDLVMAFPTFSANGSKVAFNRYAGAGGDHRSLGLVSFDAATLTFGPVENLYTPEGAVAEAVWPSFLPGGNKLLFELAIRPNDRTGTDNFGGNRSDATCESDSVQPYRCGAESDLGTRAELWSIDLDTKQLVRLDKLNGRGTLPTGPFNHGADDTLNYEPAVSPVVSGGYAWVVFTSRRLYGNIATINPYWSDPRFKDISIEPTTKKLWVAAIDLNAPPGTDPSRPAFYLPAQELMAGNSRGFWVVDPCRDDGEGCESGDECCGGYCRPNASGALVCSNQINTCANEFENCSNDGDCCGTNVCIDGRCGRNSTSGPN